jgi:hypothetical protein
MRRGFALVLTGALVSLAWFNTRVDAKPPKVALVEMPTPIDHEDGRVGSIVPGDRPPARTQGSTIAVDATGLWIAERNAGALIRSDHDGVVRAVTPLHAGLGELLLDRASDTLLVADRQADRVLRFSLAGDVATQIGELELVEPHGLALSPDGATLLVTSVANRELVAVAPATMKVRWRVELLAEPRAVAISPDGQSALVGFLSSGSLARVDLASQGRQITWHSLSPRDEVEIDSESSPQFFSSSHVIDEIEPSSRFEVPNDVGRRHARNVFALGFIGEDLAVALHQVSMPQMQLIPDRDLRIEDEEDDDDDDDEDEDEDEDEHPIHDAAYGGGIDAINPTEYWQSRIAPPTRAGLVEMDQHRVSVHQPRALAYDPTRDILYIAGYGDDALIAIRQASLESPIVEWEATLGRGSACGIDGLALAGDSLFVHCELARSVVRVDLDPNSAAHRPVPARAWVRGETLAPSLRSAQVERGAELFRRGGSWSRGGSLACSSCHPEGRSDGLSWRLGRSIRQTPMLGGRLSGTAPYKWTGEDPSLRLSFEHTIERLGGNPKDIEDAEFAALEAFVLSLPPPRPPTIDDPAALARGREIFERDCSACHAGERTTDRQQYELTTTLAEVDTPSLNGLAHSAPYYHDGSAIDLETLLDDRGSVHDMIDSSSLSIEQRKDLIVYLRSL